MLPAMDALLERARAVLRAEGEAVLALADTLNDQGAAFVEAAGLLLERCGPGGGRLVVCGVGKAGLIGRKLAATFASTGTPALFLHPAEARHGDLGMVGTGDVVLALSHSGSSEELLAILPSLRRIGCALIAITGRQDAALARHAEVALSIGNISEACPLGLAPSTSTTAMLALGDALALSVHEARHFSREHYARFHPGGALGRKLMTCAEAMRPREMIAVVGPTQSLRETLRAITAARSGCALICDDTAQLLGIFTDGDLRRALERDIDPAQLLADPVAAHATCPCRSIRDLALLQEALGLCHRRRIDELPVVDAQGRLLGLLDLQDLAGRGFEI